MNRMRPACFPFGGVDKNTLLEEEKG